MSLGAFGALASSFTWAYASAKYAQASRTSGAPALVNFARSLTVLPLYLVGAVVLDGRAALTALDRAHLPWLILSTVCAYGGGDNVFFAATRRVGISTALSIASVYPMWAALGGAVVRGEPLGPQRLAGTLLAVGGVVALVYLAKRGDEQSAATSRERTLGLVFALVASLLWAGNSFSIKMGSVGLGLASINATRFAVACIVLLPQIAWARRRTVLRAPAGGWLGLLPAVFVDGVLGSICFVYGLNHTDLAVGATLSSLAPLVSVPFGIVFGEERWSTARFIAIAVTVGGVALLLSAS